MRAAIDYEQHRFAVGAALSGCGYHAVDLEMLSSRISSAQPPGRSPAEVEAFSPCGARVQVVGKLGPFTYGSRWLTRLRCERCSWVVALNRGTVEQEIDLYTAEAGGDRRGALLREIFTSILADAPPGPESQAGHRSDLLAHAARHRPVLTVCAECSESGLTAAHGPSVSRCPHAAVVCQECSFTADSWAGEWNGVATGECVVASPCSTLLALADHYGIAVKGRGESL
ncbi:hypothetical protein A7U43_27920 (plasmid) [Mycobacterium adipatum]|uniref:Uncharacterized protein n=1 Tax=Mycobacterium adipatum TaxID=1682113 RepID=A0A172UW43_9MYCO|nr:hypothetical protein [Mycobacterium adipatum]ANE83357.1 hypothetical protein A7U43_27920 [Mycobacterium adipatum]